MVESREERAKKNKYRRKKVMLKKAHKKAGIAFFIVIIMLIVLMGRIAYINYNHGDAYSKAVLDHQTYTSTTISHRRGQILTSNGTILAYSERVYNLILDPKLILSDSAYIEPTLNALVKCFGLDKQELQNILSNNKDSHYQKLLKELSSDDIAEFKTMMTDKKTNPNIKGVWFEDSYIRKYPFSTLACDVVGFASAVNGGELGLESYYDEELSGTDGVIYSYVDEKLDVQETVKDAVDGYNVVTTIDYNIQSIIEKHIREYNLEKPSNSTAVLVMNPNNGEILGMASYPFFDLNNPRSLEGIYTDEQIAAFGKEGDSPESKETQALYSVWRNYCVSQTYEPGSTFKPFTVASGLEEGVVQDGDMFYCAGFEEIGGYTIRCHVYSSTGKHGDISLEQGLMQSCNPVMMQIAAKLGGVRFAHYQRLFGFGSKTGVDLPAEEAGIIKMGELSSTDIATNSFGQNINVTMVQMGAAFSSLINGGNYYRPHIVKRIEKESGEVVKNYDSVLVKQTVTSSTSQLMRQYLKDGVDEGLARKAGVTGYSIGGKTGTAQKGNRDDLKWVVSFIGCAPMDNPQVVLYVVVDEPYGTTGTSGSTLDVLWLSHDIFEELLPYMNIFKDSEAEPIDTTDSEDEATVQIAVPNITQ